MVMSLDDSDLEFILQLYDTAFVHLSEKAKSDFAEAFVYKLVDYGFDVKGNAKEIGDHDDHLDKAVETVLEDDEDEPEDDWLDSDFDDEWDD
jgi:hypothetical protein